MGVEQFGPNYFRINGKDIILDDNGPYEPAENFDIVASFRDGNYSGYRRVVAEGDERIVQRVEAGLVLVYALAEHLATHQGSPEAVFRGAAGALKTLAWVLQEQGVDIEVSITSPFDT